MTRINVKIDDNLQRQLRMKCVERGIHYSDALDDAIDLWLRQPEDDKKI